MTDDDTPPPPLAKADGSADMADSEAAAADAATPVAPGEAPPERPSHVDLHVEPMTYPDDGALARNLRKVDDVVGKVEQVMLVTLFTIIVLVTATHALGDRLFGHRLAIKEELVRGGSYALAMFGAAFGTYQVKHLSMDLLSRRFSPRNRLVLKVVLAAFVVMILVLVIHISRLTIHIASGEATAARILTPTRMSYAMPLACVLMIFHTLVQAIVNVDYLVRGKLPPERMRSAH